MPTKAIVICCHGVFTDAGFISEDPTGPGEQEVGFYRSHIEEGLKLVREDPNDRVLIFSGGFTKAQIEKSEARSYLAEAGRLGLDFGGMNILLEEYARDTYENAILSMCCFYQHYGKFPQELIVVTLAVKTKRVEVILRALRVPQFKVVGIGQKEGSRTPEEIAAEIAGDPLHRLPQLVRKRIQRDPHRKSHPYWDDPLLVTMFEVLARIKEDQDPHLPDGFMFPWE